MAYIGETTPLYGANETYIAELFEKWQQDPESVDAGWASFFQNLGDDDEALIEVGADLRLGHFGLQSSAAIAFAWPESSRGQR